MYMQFYDVKLWSGPISKIWDIFFATVEITNFSVPTFHWSVLRTTGFYFPQDSDCTDRPSKTSGYGHDGGKTRQEVINPGLQSNSQHSLLSLKQSETESRFWQLAN